MFGVIACMAQDCPYRATSALWGRTFCGGHLRRLGWALLPLSTEEHSAVQTAPTPTVQEVSS